MWRWWLPFSLVPWLIAAHPQLDRQHLRSLIRQARLEKATPDKPPRADREIFQLLKDLQQAGNDSLL